MKSGCIDLIPTYFELTKGATREKFEGLCVTAQGDVWVNNDNDGVDDNSGENFFAVVGQITLSEIDGSGPAGSPIDTPAVSPADVPVDVANPTGSSSSAIFALPATVLAVAGVLFH